MQYIDAKYDLLINGEWVPAEGGETFETFNPANGEKLADCANASPADICLLYTSPSPRDRG